MFSPYGLNHGESHVDAVAGVLGPGDGQAGHAVVAVTEDLDAHALVVLEYKVTLNI